MSMRSAFMLCISESRGGVRTCFSLHYTNWIVLLTWPQEYHDAMVINSHFLLIIRGQVERILSHHRGIVSWSYGEYRFASSSKAALLHQWDTNLLAWWRQWTYCNSDNWEATVSSSTENLDEAHKEWIIGPASLEQSSPFALLKWNSAVQATFLILLQLCHWHVFD